MGPASGNEGGQVVCSAPYQSFLNDPGPLTARYLRGEQSIPTPQHRRTGNGCSLTIIGAREHNLKDLTVTIPLGTLTCITGVSGSGKSTLVQDILYASAARAFRLATPRVGAVDQISGLEHVTTIRLINQEPIGKTPRSNPITYLKAFQVLRELFAEAADARRQGLTPAHFSFNTGAGRCSSCDGQGQQKLEMFFFDDLHVTCEECDGRRFKPEVLGVRVRGCSINDVLEMTVDQALDRFGDVSTKLQNPLELLQSLGLGYLRLGQPATSLSGGESQRLKIAAELASLMKVGKQREADAGILYILDEPTTGLHLEDVRKLLTVLTRLVDAGNSVIVVEHHLDVIKSADWILDLGPGGGEDGGKLVAAGTPEQVALSRQSHTGSFLRTILQESVTQGDHLSSLPNLQNLGDVG